MVLKVSGLSKSYIQGDGTFLDVLKGISFNLNSSEKVAVMGESGSGKTTFLNCVAGLDRFNSGKVLLLDKDISSLNDKDLGSLRNRDLGFVFQFHYLLKDFSVKENVMMPCLIAGHAHNKAEELALEVLEKIRLLHKAHSTPRQLSGGEQQRAAIARALVMKPALLVMDEPTGNLDEHLSDDIISAVIKLCKENKTSILMATHNKKIADQMDKILVLKEGGLWTQK
jgi:lipoprotein-releasing system ATP-binding protein